jgi:hypothetical protein
MRLYWILASSYTPPHVTKKNNFWPHVIQSGCGYQEHAAERSYRYGRKSGGVGKGPGCLGRRQYSEQAALGVHTALRCHRGTYLAAPSRSRLHGNHRATQSRAACLAMGES